MLVPLVLAIALLGGCGDDGAPPPARNAGSQPVPEPVAESGARPSTADPTVDDPIVDLLHTVQAAVAVSSAYRNRDQHVSSLADGDLETAWNSRTGDLVGAWIEVRLPPEVQVSSIEMTAGFTKIADSDLFTGNHRVRRVRVLRERVALGEHDLDVESRALQSLPAEGGGGVYRIEVLSTVPGSREDWREVCVSELRVMGRSNGAPMFGLPRFAVGTLPALPEPIAVALDGDALEEEIGVIYDAWAELEHQLLEAEFNPLDRGISRDERRSLVRARREVVERVARLVEPGDARLATELRELATEGPWEWGERRTDFDRVAAALNAVVAGSPDRELRCVWALLRVLLRLSRVEQWAGLEHEAAADAVLEHGEHGEPDQSPAVERRLRAAERESSRFDSLVEALDGDLDASIVSRITATTPPSHPKIRLEWNDLLAETAPVEELCR
jgi:hypothetical protein